MKSGMISLFSDSDLERWFDNFQYQSEDKMFKLLQAGGEMFVKYARESGNYHDRSGNLRSSIGYIIVFDGEELSANFEKASKGTDRDTGEEKAHKLAEEIAEAYPDGFIMIGVAGMDYAMSVEAMGYDVATGASIKAENWMRKALETIFNKM